MKWVIVGPMQINKLQNPKYNRETRFLFVVETHDGKSYTEKVVGQNRHRARRKLLCAYLNNRQFVKSIKDKDGDNGLASA